MGFQPAAEAEPPRRGKSEDPALKREVAKLRAENALLAERLAALDGEVSARDQATASRQGGPKALLKRLR